MEFKDLLSIDIWEMINTWINLLILFLIVKKFLFKPVKNLLDNREKEVAEAYKNAEVANENARKLEADYNDKIGKAKEDATAIVKNAEKKANIRAEEIVDKANEKAAVIVKRAGEDAENEKQRAVKDAKDAISELAVMVASKVVEKEITEEDHQRMIEDFIAGEVK